MWLVSSQRGSAVTDFVLVAFPLLAIFSMTIAISLGSYARVVLLDATIEGARYAALADQDIAEGILRTKKIVADSLGPALNVLVDAKSAKSGTIETIHFSSSISFKNGFVIPLLTASSVATREVEY